MKLKQIAIVVLLALVLCYIGAGAPSMELLFKPSVVLDGLALKAGTWHYANRVDRMAPIADMLASRFYTLMLAVLCCVCGLAVVRIELTWKRLAFFVAIVLALQFVFYYAQVRAYYMPW
ncbi:hypothetical protein BGV67_10910 [Burkholderia ubonensis]|uniref:hypothetical protein n=1 Tax=Burkholderia ubonensis TaxID=101571 RepID=UPI00075497F0|nr:hypothetical protein [Burkholderia ubonensis]KVP19130.1 hypothetical protein WJ84_11960 [Burkholderia ubonensis]KWF04669.1 hypothetical protein WL82_01835 [Burkholderia ubonensis]OJA39737.1 hypothetical protein BGV47_11275 [Burkholderia ubonensis]OJA69982.1 hypothetical protein BGV67_10910 [Burkholderia ubonensis]OJB30300.1 hypothetical protein BGV55_14400 [Burkholderia ubonensis]